MPLLTLALAKRRHAADAGGLDLQGMAVGERRFNAVLMRFPHTLWYTIRCPSRASP